MVKRKSKTKTVYKYITKKTRSTRNKMGFNLPNVKNVLIGSGTLVLARKLPNFAGAYQSPVDKGVAGAISYLMGAKRTGKSLIEVGSYEAGALLIDKYVAPALTGVLVNGGLNKNQNQVVRVIPS